MNDVTSRPRALSLFALPGIPMVEPGDDLTAMIAEGFKHAGEMPAAGDVLVIAQKIVSKSEGRYADLASVEPSAKAIELAELTEKDPRMVELILGESRAVVRHRPNVIIVEHRLGFVMANAGIDSSNVEPGAQGERVLLLPEDPDGSAQRIRQDLSERLGINCAVIVNDSVGRAWRIGTVGLALGAAGLPSLLDLRGRSDLFGRPLAVTQVGLADELAAAASLLQGEADEGMPVVVVRGLMTAGPRASGAALIRDEADDLFR
jgi:coenzyme F420-0:L-glutamate ligase/coenzyme F420-1:gamma-L-glutamate ligase